MVAKRVVTNEASSNFYENDQVSALKVMEVEHPRWRKYTV
jgi:hypothetical protein